MEAHSGKQSYLPHQGPFMDQRWRSLPRGQVRNRAALCFESRAHRAFPFSYSFLALSFVTMFPSRISM